MSKDDEQEPEAPDFQAEVESFVEGVAGLFDSLKDIFVKSKEEVVRGAALGKVRIDVYQLRKDREHFLQRLGEEAYDLLVAGEIAHPSLDKAFGRIQGVDRQIVEHEEEIARIAAEQAAASERADAAGAANEEPAGDEAPPEPEEPPPARKPKAKKKD